MRQCCADASRESVEFSARPSRSAAALVILAQGRVVAHGEVATLLSQGAQTVLRTDDPIRAEMVLRGSD